MDYYCFRNEKKDTENNKITLIQDDKVINKNNKIATVFNTFFSNVMKFQRLLILLSKNQ